METLFNNTHHKIASENKTITVLGHTFANDEERRAFFREELRKQLPELKKIEGFPIGEDEDIINLSDPPYYTACPNPWINDFIAEWEAEKAELEAQGKRVSDFDVDEPYASDVSEGKNNPIYNAHSYHTKVPHPAIMRYILHYTQPGDIVFDGFAGTGMTGVAAQQCGIPDKVTKEKIESEWNVEGKGSPIWGSRKAILGDLSPIASFVAYNYNIPVNAIQFEHVAKRILRDVEENYGWMYKTIHESKSSIYINDLAGKIRDCKSGTELKQLFNGTKIGLGKINCVVWSDVFTCPVCSCEMVFWDVAVDKENNKVNNHFYCPHCTQKLAKQINIKDLSIKKAEKSKVTIYDNALKQSISQTKTVPVLIKYNIGGKRYEKKPDVADLALIEKSEKIDIFSWFPTDRMPEGDEARRNDREGITHVHHFYTRRNLCILSDIWEKSRNDPQSKLIFNSIHSTLCSKMVRYNMGNRGNGIVSGTLYVASLSAESNVFKIAEGKIADLKKIFISKYANLIQEGSASRLNTIQDNSIDYIFTDPPFGSNIMYSELNFQWESWLKVKTNNHKEAIQNNTQSKGFSEYIKLMTECFEEYYRVLKSKKWMTVEFSNTNAGIWNGIQTAIQKAGFVIANVAALDKQQNSFKAVTTLTAVKQDLVISCYKPSSEFVAKFQHNQFNEVGIWDFIDEHLSHLPVHLVKGNATTAVVERNPKILFDRLIAFYVQRGLPVPIDAGLFQKGLRERFIERDGMYFTAEQVHEYDSKKAQLHNFIQLSLLVASEQDGVLWLRRELEFTPQTYQELQPKWMQALAGVRKGDILPELKDILEENFLQNETGAWYLPDLENEIDLERIRTRRMLRQFDIYKEQALKPKGKIKEARVEALRVGFKQCYKDKDFKTIVMVGDCIPNNLLMEDEVLLQYYDIAMTRV